MVWDRHAKGPAKLNGQPAIGLTSEQAALIEKVREACLAQGDPSILTPLEQEDREAAQLVKLRFFAGLTIRQAAAALAIAESTADADWAYAKSWLRLELADASDQGP